MRGATSRRDQGTGAGAGAGAGVWSSSSSSDDPQVQYHHQRRNNNNNNNNNNVDDSKKSLPSVLISRLRTFIGGRHYLFLIMMIISFVGLLLLLYSSRSIMTNQSSSPRGDITKTSAHEINSKINSPTTATIKNNNHNNPSPPPPPATAKQTTTSAITTTTIKNKQELDCRALVESYNNHNNHPKSEQQQQPSPPPAFQMVRTKTMVPFNMSVYPASDDVWVSRSIINDGCWECDHVQRMLEALQKNAADGAFLLDMGSNIGMMTLSAAAIGSDVYAFEPFQKNYLHTCRSITENHGFAEKVHFFDLALSRRNGGGDGDGDSDSTSIVQFKTDVGTNFGGISVQEITTTTTTATTDTETWKEGIDYAHAVTIDSWRHYHLPQNNNNNNRPIVLKLDVEGAEMDALMGAMNYLRENDIIFAIMELRMDKLNQNETETDEFVNVFQAKGLKPMLNKKQELVPLGPDWRNWKTEGGIGTIFDLTWIQE